MSHDSFFDDLPNIIHNFDIENKQMTYFPLMSDIEILYKIKKKYGPDYIKKIDERGNYYILLKARTYLYLQWLITKNKY